MKRILVVDDDAELRETLQEALEGENYQVSIGRNGDEGIRLAKEMDFDLIMLDLVMPGLSGMESLLLLRRDHPRVKIIMMTAFSTIENAVEAMRRGADDYLTKPFRLDEMITGVKRLIEEARFRDCQMMLDMDLPFNSLSNSIRRHILLLLRTGGKKRFMEITRELGIEDHTKVNFHLRMLKDSGMLDQDSQKYYCLSPQGEKVTECLQVVIENLSS